ncbi:MAG: glycosyltransferase [Burkholderiales bacterium]|nr:glycosyltransferase [Burkholderiales bacterium]
MPASRPERPPSVSAGHHKPRILIIGEAVALTGFARVIHSVFSRLTEHYELHQLATRYDGGPHDWPWTLHVASKGASLYGYDQVAPLLDTLRPDLVFLLYDIPFQPAYWAQLRRAAWQPPVVMYTPVEAGPIAPEIIEPLAGVARYVMYNEFGRGVIGAAMADIRTRRPDFHFPALDVIAHGVDCDRFFPLVSDDQSPSRSGSVTTTPNADAARRLKARCLLGIDAPETRDGFIVLNANRNMPRKRIDLTMQGFALFARGKPANVKLYLHMATEDSGWNVLLLAKRYGIYDRLIMTRADNVRPTFDDATMNLLYNACDVGLTTSTGEGWGMVAFEHGATRAAQVMPRHTSLAELWNGVAEFIEPVGRMTWPGNLTEGHVVSAEGVAAALQRVYENPDLRDDLAQRAYANAHRPEFAWDSVALQWRRLFDDMLLR